jgi:FKBP-type peptidyl-prolyl cis-trans isomerase
VADIVRLASGVTREDFRKSDGIEAAVGDLVTLHYQASASLDEMLLGNFIDDTWLRNSPIRFRVGAGEVLLGVDEGIVGMRLASERRLVIPPHLALGRRGAVGRLPPDHQLVVNMYLVDISNVTASS